ncbi:polysaccharide deacetylase family protein [Bifidobacterium sp. MA2]|uniref:Polysaccharide deacetylase family protein n=1 Tax=Bifidobacterium santillanense TaxID=2809028 RepID=A0ABS5UNM4_9BIFI|nr:polysaccharide deacetylase family protein [Bifidobacterium santillanense]MBT1172453.1 polysaccharide deacetylase family protein [Bifidobacterium santillanense]
MTGNPMERDGDGDEHYGGDVDAIDDPTLLDGLTGDGGGIDGERHGHGPARGRRRAVKPIVAAVIALFAAGLVFAGWTVARSVLDSRRQAHETALASCRSSRRTYTETATTFTPTLAKSKTLLEKTKGFDASETRARLQQKVNGTSGIDFAALAAADCTAGMSTAELTDLADRYGSSETQMETAMISMPYDAQNLEGILDGLTVRDARANLTTLLDKARTAYSRSDGKADDALRATLQQAIDTAQRVLDTTSTTDAATVAAQAGPLTRATDAVIAAMPLDCHFADCVALTFDDGPDKRRTPKVLAALAKAKVPATFFLQGQFVNGSNVDLVKRMVAEGHSVGSISWRHTQMHAMGADQLAKWFKDTDDVIAGASGRPVTLFRPPDGAWSDALRTAARDNGQAMIMWSVDSGDWDGKVTASTIAKRVVSDAAPGAIVAMHDGNAATAKALPEIVKGLEAKGYHLVTIDTLLAGALDPVQPGDMVYGLDNIQRNNQGTDAAAQ